MQGDWSEMPSYATFEHATDIIRELNQCQRKLKNLSTYIIVLTSPFSRYFKCVLRSLNNKCQNRERDVFIYYQCFF